MKKILFVLGVLMVVSPVMADYCDENTCDNYVGFRIHKNENIAFEYNLEYGGTTTLRRDNFGLGAVVGNRLSDYAKVEFETSYTGGESQRGVTNFDYDVWANMFNLYLFNEYSGAISPYVGVGIGMAGIWADVDSDIYHKVDMSFDFSYQAMFGVNFALNNRVDVNLGLKYQYYGAVEHGNKFATTDVSGTEFYFGAVYKFGLK
ncbi:MAG: outer membrane beta-barrel protein [Alphaproteobacteria bacterium]